MRSLSNSLSAGALLFCALGALILCAVIRPFRDLAIDGPIALASWGIGALLGISCLFLKGRSLTLSVISILANVLPLLGALGLLWALSRSNLAWH